MLVVSRSRFRWGAVVQMQLHFCCCPQLVGKHNEPQNYPCLYPTVDCSYLGSWAQQATVAAAYKFLSPVPAPYMPLSCSCPPLARNRHCKENHVPCSRCH